ncbi:MAG TPA: acyl-CoA dehydrogenase family protein [Xanthobacteraceae bacterium]|nr:acyl-CoA dehydrogenase family protein [Xanthobacteraceae bacterium]
MYNLHLSPEQLEIRDTVRDFGAQKLKAVLLKSDRLDARDRTLPMGLLDQASQMGLRSLALSEAAGGVGADALTCCLVAEELAVCDADFAAVLAETSWLAHLLFDQAMTDAQREKFLAGFLENDRCHLAFAGREAGDDTRLGIHYHRPAAIDAASKTTAAKAGNEWVINGAKDGVANAPIAGLFAVLVRIADRPEAGVLLVPADAPGVSVAAHERPWHHGVSGAVTFKDCRVPADNLLKDGAAALLAGAAAAGRGIPLAQAINLGIGRAAYEAALEYARLRVQGGRPLIEHQAMGTKLADVAIRLEVARAAIWNAAWASDHPGVFADQSLPDLPLATVAQVFVSETLYKAVRDAAELFGAMGVMRDMPLQKYVHDALVCAHSHDGNTEARLRIAESLAGYRRAGVPQAAAE